jgi:hypothetical protein
MDGRKLLHLVDVPLRELNKLAQTRSPSTVFALLKEGKYASGRGYYTEALQTVSDLTDMIGEYRFKNFRLAPFEKNLKALINAQSAESLPTNLIEVTGELWQEAQALLSRPCQHCFK